MHGARPSSFTLYTITYKVVVYAQLSGQITEYTELQPLLFGVHSVMRVKLALAGEGGGARPPPLLHLPSPLKVQCTLQLSRQKH